MVAIGHLYELPARLLTPGHREALTVKQDVPQMWSAGEPEEFEVFEDDGETVRVPRHYGLRHFGAAPHARDPRPGEGRPGYRFEGQLNPSVQVPALNAVVRAFRDGPGSGILSLYCGAGKTVVALRLVSKMGLPTLILVHKEFLLQQWRERIAQFLPEASVGVVRGPKADVEGHHIVLGMIQTVATHDYGDADPFAGFGLTIVDEAHHVAARVFSRSMHRASSRYNLGLSATPRRADGLTKVLLWFLDSIVFEAARPAEDVLVRVTEYHDRAQREAATKRGPNVPRMVTDIVAMGDRNRLIVDLVAAERAEGRRVIVLSDRKEHLRNLDALLAERHLPGTTAGFYVGGMKAHEREKSNEAEVVWATFAMASEGYDNAKLNTVLLASPKADVEQSVGRILRGNDGRELQPRVLDIADQYSIFCRYNDKRARLYARMSYAVRRDARYCDSRGSLKRKR